MSEQPQHSTAARTDFRDIRPDVTQEWTVKHGNMIYQGEQFVGLIPDEESRNRVVTMHNAALKKITISRDLWEETAKKLDKQLAAAEDATAHFRRKYNEVSKLLGEANEQLAAVTKQRDGFRRALEERIGEVDGLRAQLGGEN
jgi:hypothetical protein